MGRSAPLELIRLAYEGVLRKQAWGEMLALACRVFRSQDAYLGRAQVREHGPRLLLTHGVDSKVAETYRESWISPPANPILDILQEERFRGVVSPREVMPASVFERTEFFEVCRRPRRVQDELGCGDAGGGGQIRFLSVNRARGDPPFGDRERRLMAFLFPHVMQALEHDAVIAAERARSARLGRAVDELDEPVLQRDPDGRLLPLNPAGETFLRRRQVGGSPSGSLGARDPRHLLRRVSTIGTGSAGGIETAVSGGQAYRVLASPHFEEGRFVGEILRLRRTLSSIASAPADAASALTHHESKVLALLCEGRTTADICVTLGIGLNTLNTHLKHLFQKTGCHTRSQLVARFGLLHWDQVVADAAFEPGRRSA